MRNWRVLVWLTLCITPQGWDVLPRPAVAQAVTTFNVPTFANSGQASVGGVISGPDGNLYFSDIFGGQLSGTSAVGRITTAGAATLLTNNGKFLATTSGLTIGSDGAIWLAEYSSVPTVARVTIGGMFSPPVSLTTFPQGGIAAGPDGAVWLPTTLGQSPQKGAQMLRVTTAGQVNPLPNNGAYGTSATIVGDIVTGPDGAVWTTDSGTNTVWRFTTGGTLTSFPLDGTLGEAIAAGPDGAVWTTLRAPAMIVRLTTGGTTGFPLPSSAGAAVPDYIVTGPDGALWFGDTANSQIGRVTTNGQFSFYPLPNGDVFPTRRHNNAITVGPDSALWFVLTTPTDDEVIARFAVPPIQTQLLAAVLPSSRSVQVGAPASAFATIINTGPAATGCGIAPITTVPASFAFQTTDPTTNVVTGSPDTPVLIGAGASQSFVFAYAPTAPFAPADVSLGFFCAGTPAAPIFPGVSTLSLTGSATPVPDIIALAATPSNNGILKIILQGSSGSGAFATATTNVGSAGTISVSANTGSASLPLSLALCQTNPQTGQCLAPPAANVTTTINSNETPTFAIFANASSTIPFGPASSRIFVHFADANGVERGTTSVAVETQ